MNIEKIADQIISLVLKDVANTLSGFQRIYTFDELEETFGITIAEKDKIEEIFEELESRREVLNIQIDEDGFDIVFGTAYVPGYVDDEE